MQQTADVVIVGAGVIGLSLGRVLAGDGLEVVAFDGGRPGAGASSAAAGMLTVVPEGPVSPAFLELCRRSLAGYRAWCDELHAATGIDVEYRSEGSLFPAANASDLPLLAAMGAVCEAAGLEVEALSREEACRREPLLSTLCHGALAVTGNHQVHTTRLVDALRIAATAAGVTIASDTRVLGVRIEDGHVTGVSTSRGVVATPAVVIAAGAWSGDLGGREGIPHIPIRPVKGEIVCLTMTGTPLGQIVYGTECYLVPRRDGRLLVGATEVDGSFDTTVTAGAVQRLLTAATRLVPAIDTFPVVGWQVGLRPTTPDRLPLLGPLGPRGLHAATGHYRKGILLAPETARLLAECIRTGEVPEALGPFSPRRFETAA